MKRTGLIITLLAITVSVFATSDIAVDPTSLSADLMSGDVEVQTLNIANEGDTDLTWSLTIMESAVALNAREHGFYADESRSNSFSNSQFPRSNNGFDITPASREEGDILAEYYEPYPNGATGLAWAANELYVIAYMSEEVYKVNPESGEILSTFPTHGMPYGMIYDGQYLWIGNSSGNVYGYDLDGTEVGSFASPVTDYLTLAWDGQYFIVSATWTLTNPTFYKVDYEGNVVATYTSSFGDYLAQTVWVPAHDGGNLWGVHDMSGDVRRFDLSGGVAVEVNNFSVPINEFRHAITHDGTDLWIADWVGPYYQVDDGIEELSWLYTDIVTGTVPAGTSQDISVTFDASGMVGGDYASEIIIANNDPDENPVIVPATLGVTGAPSIGLNPDELDFGELYIDGVYTETIIVYNTGTDVLDVTDVAVSGGEFSVDGTLFSIAAGGYYDLDVTFTPTFTGLQTGDLTLSSNDPTNPTISADIFGTGVTSPDIAWDPTSMTSDLFTGDIEIQTLTLTNEGGSDLEWELSIEEVTAARNVNHSDEHPSHYFLDVEKGMADPRIGPDVIRDAGGPDLYGYSWIDSDEAGGPAFNWEDISGTGINITGNMWDDNVSGPYPIGFEFDFYGNTYTEFYVSSNGFIRFGVNDNSGCCSGQPLPLPDAINNVIAWAWRDGYPFGNTYYENFADKTIIQFDDYGTCCSQENGSATVEIILYSNGEIKINYLELIGNYTDGNQSVGIENIDGTDGLQVAFNTDYLHDELALVFADAPDWVVVDEYDGVIPAGSSQDIQVTFDATGLLGGEYMSDIIVNSNDPDENPVIIPATLNVTGAPSINVDPDIVDYGEQYVGGTYPAMIQVSNPGTDLLDVTNIQVSGGEFGVDGTLFSLAPGEAHDLEVIWTPTTVGLQDGLLTFTSNDPSNPTLDITLAGNSVTSPDIAWDPTSMSADLFTGDSEIQTLTITNEGGSNLDWEIGSVMGEPIAADRTLAEIESIRNNYVPDATDNNVGLPHVSAIEMETFLNREGDREETVHILGWSAFSDPDGEELNTIEAISWYFTDFTIVNTPTLDPATLEAELEDKDLFLVYEQESGGGDFEALAASLGPVLQDFVSSGGGIIFCGMSSGNSGEFMFYTGFFDGMWLSDSYSYGIPLSVIEEHDVTAGVEPNFFDANATFYVDITNDDALKLVQNDEDLSDVVTVREYGSGRAVYMGFDYYDFDSNVAQLIANAVQWAGNSSRVDWLSFSEEGGTLAAGASLDIDVTFDASDMIGGEYTADIIITSNDPDENPAIIPATLNVTGAPSISVEPGAVDYGEQYVGGTYPAIIEVSNGGTDLLDVTDIQIAGGEFGVDGTLFSLAPGESYGLEVIWTPTTVGLQDGELTLTSNDPTNPTVTVALSGNSVTSPDIAWDPTSMSADLFTGDTEIQTLTLTNEGGSDLEWEISIEEVTAARNVDVPEEHHSHYFLDVEKGVADPRVGPDVIRDAGGPDLYGYSWIDSDEAGGPAFNWEDISGTGINITGNMWDDNVSGPYPIGFEFDFYGNIYTEFYVSSNGFIRFGVNDNSGCCSGQPIPLADNINNIIAWAWRDGYPFGNTYYENFADKTIIQFDDYGTCCSPENGSATVEIILYSNGEIKINYLELIGNYTDGWQSVGIENIDGTDGLQVAFNTDYLHNELALVFADSPDWVVVDEYAGVLSAGSSQDIQVTFDATGMFGGEYVSDIIVTSNDPDENPAIIPATLNVTGAPSINLDPDVVAYGEQYVGGTYPAIIEVSNGGTDLLDVTDIQIAGGEFGVDGTLFSLSPGESYGLEVTWTPTTVGLQDGELTLTSNDPSNPTVIIPLSGSSVTSPDIAWDPTSMSADLFTGDTETQTLTLTNEGGSDLIWELNFADQPALREVNNSIPEIGVPIIIENSTSPHAPIPSYYGTFGGSRTDEEVLVVRDFNPWGGDVVPLWLELETIVTVISSFDLAGTDLGDYDVLYWGGDESFTSEFYNNIAAKMDDISDFLTNGGVVFSATGSQGGGSFLLPGDVLAINNSGGMQYLEEGFCETEGVPTEVGGTSSYHDTFESFDAVPNGVEVFSYGEGGQPVGIAYDWGFGRAIFIGNPFEFYLPDGGSYPEQIDMWMAAASCAIENTEADWLTSDIQAGVISAGGSQEILITFDATGMFGGDYFADIVVTSNDPNENPAIIPAALNVTGAPSIGVEPAVVDYGEQYVGGTYLSTVIVSNPGTDLLDVTDVQFVGDEFSLDLTLFSLAPGESHDLIVTWTPTTLGLHEGVITLTCNDPTNPTVTVPMSGMSVTAPDIAWDPASMSADLFTGDSEIQTLTISNEGGSNLEWAISLEEVLAARTVNHSDEHPSHYFLDVEKGVADPRVGPDVIRDAGGPDLYGYSWIDSDEAGGPAFNWEDISGTGINITGNMWDDNVSGPYPIGFEFDFYGNIYTEFYVSSNGFIRFGVNDNSGCCSGQPIPLADNINNIIAWAWRDGYPTGNTYYENFADKTIIQFDGYGVFGGDASATIEIILYSNDEIKINYLELIGGYTDGNHSIGIENIDGTDGLQVAFNTEYLHDELALVFADTPDWITVDEYAGVLAAGSSQDIQVTFDATGMLGGEYLSDIIITSNDPNENPAIIPATLNVTGASDIEVDQTVLDYGGVFIDGSLSYDLLISNMGTDVLEITDIQISGGDFSADASTASLAPGEEYLLEVTFAPTNTDTQNETLTLVNNDPSNPEVVISLSGTGLVPPDITWDPEYMESVLNLGVMETQILTITNDGGSALDWNLNVHEMSAVDLSGDIGFYADDSRTPLPDAHMLPNPAEVGAGEASDRDEGDILGEYWAPDPNGATGMAWIGDALYVVSFVNEAVLRVDPVTGELLSSFTIHTSPFGLAYDGQYLWIGDGSGNIYGYTLDGDLVGSFSSPEFGHLALTWDGANFLVAAAFAFNPTIYKVNYSGDVLDDYQTTFESSISQMVWVSSHEDGNLWTVDESSGVVRRLDMSGSYFNEVSNFSIPVINFRYAITHDGYDLWIAEWNGPYYQVDDGIEEQHWIYSDITAGTLAPGNSQDVEITFSALEVLPGDYAASIFINSNDPDESEVTIPVSFTVNPTGLTDLTEMPETYVLQDNFPNPFNPSTTLFYGIPEESDVSLIIYDIRGHVVTEVASGRKEAGWYDYVWHGLDRSGHTVATGVYFARFQAGDYTRVVKMVYLK